MQTAQVQGCKAGVVARLHYLPLQTTVDMLPEVTREWDQTHRPMLTPNNCVFVSATAGPLNAGSFYFFDV